MLDRDVERKAFPFAFGYDLHQYAANVDSAMLRATSEEASCGIKP